MTEKYYSILSDEVVDIARKEQVSIVLRFVDSNCNNYKRGIFRFREDY